MSSKTKIEDEDSDWPKLPALMDDETFEDVQQDIHILLVLIDALNQAEFFVNQRNAGELAPPPVSQKEECVIS